MVKITAVDKKSAAYRAGVRRGDVVETVNGNPAVDELDFLYYEGERVTLGLAGKGEVSVCSDEVEVRAENALRTCHNHCVFCFVDQMPKGLRESLYVKDDDYAMSFECGNFVTLTNLTDADLDRIVRLNLSPLYVSVQTMNPELRCELLRNRFAGKIVGQIDRLANAGIELHCQSVVVPGKNDGEDLIETARALFRYYPNVRDLAVVPTGLTKFREGLPVIPDVDGAYSAALLDEVDRLNAEFGVNFVLPADEYFIKANRPFKDASFYGDFSQIENGIGMTSKFTAEFSAEKRSAKRKKRTRVACVCGTSAAGIIGALCEEANASVQNLEARAFPVVNGFFGESVTCTGLLTGADIYAALSAAKGTYDEVILSSDTLKSFEDVFLCGMTLKELKKKLRFRKIRVNSAGGSGFFRLLAGE
ncbi:MAG: DUF512 domain-containing protein [Candidatus Gallimonas sp.]